MSSAWPAGTLSMDCAASISFLKQHTLKPWRHSHEWIDEGTATPWKALGKTLLLSLQLDGNFVDLAGKASLVATDTDTFDHGRLIIEPHIRGLVGGKH